jgi:serine/threonine-protein kinase RsbW
MSAPSTTKTTLRIANVMDDLKEVVPFVEAYGRDHGLPVTAINKLNLCLDEILSNTIKYGYDGRTGGVISVTLSIDGPYLAAVIEDDARPFDPRHAKPPELSADLATRKIGGLGLHFVNSLMDVVDYRRSDRCNRTTLKTNLRPPGASGQDPQ